MLGQRQLGFLPQEALLVVDAQNIVTVVRQVPQWHVGLLIEMIQPLGCLGRMGDGKVGGKVNCLKCFGCKRKLTRKVAQGRSWQKIRNRIQNSILKCFYGPKPQKMFLGTKTPKIC